MSKSDEVIGGVQGEVHTKTPGLYQAPKLRNLIFYFCTVCFGGGDPPQPGFIGSIQQEVHAKTPGLYEVPKLRNLNLIF